MFHFIKSFKLGRSYGSIVICRCVNMFKVIALIVVGIFLMTFGTYFLSIANIQLPKIDVNWAVVGFVTIIGSIVTFGSAFAVSRLA
jgi:hypothetical protein